MKSRKTLVAASVFAACTIAADAQVDLQFTTHRQYRHIPAGVQFLEGELALTLWDGNAVWGCTDNFFFPPSTQPPCPLGATGFVTTSAEIITDPYREFFAVNPATLIEPRQPQDLKLYAAPYSQLPRPIGAFTDRSYFIWYNIRTGNIREHPVTRYGFSRPYTSRSAMDQEVVPGVYQWQAPRLVADRFSGSNTPLQPVGLSVTYAPIPEGYAKVVNVNMGFRFVNVSWSEDGYAQLDPRLPSRIRWEGNNQDRVFPNTDRMYFAMLIPETPGDPLSPILPDPDAAGGEAVAFPFFDVGNLSRILLPTALDKEYVLPPGFLPPPVDPTRPFDFGRELIARVTLQRDLPTTSITRDTSSRDYELPVRFTNTFAGFVQQWFGTTGASDADRAPGADPDGDGRTNFEEWTQGTNPLVPDEEPVEPDAMPQFVRAGGATRSGVAEEDHWYLAFSKLAYHDSTLKYQVEISSDLKQWAPIKANDASWQVIDDIASDKLVVRSRTSSQPPQQTFFRLVKKFQ